MNDPRTRGATGSSGAPGHSLAYRIFSGLAANVLRFRWVVVLIVIVGTGLAIRDATNLTINSANEIWLVEGDPQLHLMRKFERLFMNDDFVLVLVESDDFFQADIIREFGKLADDLERNVPYVADATWLGNAEFVEGFGDTVEISELMEDVPATPEEMAEVKRKAFGEPLYINNLISPDGRIAGLVVEMTDYPDDVVDPRKLVAPAVRAVVEKPEYDGLDLHAVGGPLLDYDLDEVTGTETRKLMFACVAVQAAILFWVGRGVRGIVAPLLVVNLAVAWTFGTIRLLGFELNLMVIIVPILLICVGIGDSMHVIAEFHDQRDRGLSRREALVEALGVVGLPCLLTTVTTAAGFLSFMSAPVKPYREMGVYCATGTAQALLLTFLVLPVLYFWAPGRARTRARESQRARNDVFDRMLAAVYRVGVRRPRQIVAVFVVLTAVAVAGAAQVEVQSNTVKMFRPNVPLRQAYEYVDEKMGGSMSIEMMIDSGESSGVTDPDFLARMAELERFVKAHPLTTTSTSVLDILRQTRRAFNENRDEYYSIPESREEASQYLLIYEMSGGANKEKYVTYDYDVARLTARTRSMDSKDVSAFLDDVGSFAEQTFAETQVEIDFTGILAWVKVMNERIAQGQQVSFLTAAVVITFIMMTVLRSVKLGLISMIPNVFPVLMTLGLMGIAGIYMDMSMMSIGAIIIGVAVDDTIHFFMRFRREFGVARNYADALSATISSVGRPIMFTTVTLSLGFAVMLLSSVTGMMKFGALAGYAFTWALLADLLLAPALLILLEPLGPERS